MLRKNRIRLLALGAALIVVVGSLTFFWHRAHSTNFDNERIPTATTNQEQPKRTVRPHVVVSQTPLPSENLPLADTFATLKQLSDAGDAIASMRLYKDLKKCDSRLASLSTLNGIYFHRSGQTDAEYEQQVRQKSQQEPEVKKALDNLDRTDALCKDIGANTIEAGAEYLHQAALQNDPEAEVCYASSYELGPPYLSDAWFDYAARWQREAPYIAQQALNQGQPGILAPLIEAYLPDDSNGLKFFSLHEALSPNPQMAYTLSLLYARLAKGADLQHARNNLDALSKMLEPGQLSEAQAASDKLWPRFEEASNAGAPLVSCPEFLSLPADVMSSQEGQ